MSFNAYGTITESYHNGRRFWLLRKEEMRMTAYEVSMIILGSLTLVFTVVGIIVKLILYIIDITRDTEKDAKK